jgi:hypothetical protein
MDSGLLTFAVVAIVTAFLIGITYAARRRAPIERGRVPVYEQMCSGRVGWYMGANYPAIRLSLYDTFMVVGFFSPIVVPYKDIVRAEMRRDFLSGRLVIESKNGATFRLSVREPERVLNLLRRA